MARPIANVTGNTVRTPKRLPPFFSTVRHVTNEDLRFLETDPRGGKVFIGNVRSGSKVLDIKVHIPGEEMFTHHVLVAATTGRGKSNLVKVMLWSIIGTGKFGVLVLDPHDEYYGRSGPGLKDHPEAKRFVRYYSPKPPPGRTAS